MGRKPMAKRGNGWATLRVTNEAQRRLVRISRRTGESLTAIATRLILQKEVDSPDVRE